MQNFFATAVALAAIVSSPASAANRLLYFMADDGAGPKSFNVAMEPVYERLFKKGDTLVCAFKSPAGATAVFELEPPQCPSDLPSLSIELRGKTTEGRVIQARTSQSFIDHKYVLLGGSLEGLADNQPPLGMGVASAVNYAKMGTLQPISTVPTVLLSSEGSADQLLPGSMACWMEHRDSFCH